MFLCACIHTYCKNYSVKVIFVWLLQSQGLFNWWVLNNKRHCSFSLSCMWTARVYLWPTVRKFPSHYSNFNCCNYSKFQWQRHSCDSQLYIDKCKVHAWNTTNEFATRNGKFTYTKVKRTTKQKALFLFLVMWNLRLINYCWPLYHSQPI